MSSRYPAATLNHGRKRGADQHTAGPWQPTRRRKSSGGNCEAVPNISRHDDSGWLGRSVALGASIGNYGRFLRVELGHARTSPSPLPRLATLPHLASDAYESSTAREHLPEWRLFRCARDMRKLGRRDCRKIDVNVHHNDYSQEPPRTLIRSTTNPSRISTTKALPDCLKIGHKRLSE